MRRRERIPFAQILQGYFALIHRLDHAEYHLVDILQIDLFLLMHLLHLFLHRLHEMLHYLWRQVACALHVQHMKQILQCRWGLFIPKKKKQKN